MYMQMNDLLDSDLLLEMAYTQKKAERVITGLEKPVNDHLLKLWTISDAYDRVIWIDNLVNWIDEIGEIVLRPNNARPPHVFYYKLLYFEPFGGGSGIPNLLRRLRRLYREGVPVQIDLAPEALLTRIQAFHRDLSSECARGMMRDGQIRRFLKDH